MDNPGRASRHRAGGAGPGKDGRVLGPYPGAVVAKGSRRVGARGPLVVADRPRVVGIRVPTPDSVEVRWSVVGRRTGHGDAARSGGLSSPRPLSITCLASPMDRLPGRSLRSSPGTVPRRSLRHQLTCL